MITSRDNQKLKFARKVRDGRESGFVFLEGVRLVGEAMRSGLKIEDVFISEDFDAKSTDIPGFISPIKPLIVADRIFDSITDTKNSQGVVVIARRPDTSVQWIEAALTKESEGIPVVIFLSQVNNPSNLGAILRTAEAAGAIGMIISKNSADVFSPRALRAAMGSSLRLPVWENAGFKETIEWARGRGLITTAADIGGIEPYTGVDWAVPRLLVFGSEAHGLSEIEREEMDQIVRIPMENGVESLNLAVSAGIILFEAKRQGNR
jgi:RNA methyltransferase, TrmH family